MADDLSANTKSTVRDLELLLAEYFGRDGDGGKFKALEEQVDKHEQVIDTLKTFRIQVLALVAVGGAVASILTHFISKLF